MSKELTLSPEQTKKVEAINQKYAAKAEVMRAEARKESLARREAHDAEMKAVLTADQYAKWAEKRSVARSKGQEMRKTRHAEPRKEIHRKKAE